MNETGVPVGTVAVAVWSGREWLPLYAGPEVLLSTRVTPDAKLDTVRVAITPKRPPSLDEQIEDAIGGFRR